MSETGSLGTGPHSASNQRQAYVWAILTVACWSTSATAFKLALRELDVVQLLFVSNLVAVAFLLAWVLISGRWALFLATARNAWRLSAGLGLLNPLTYYLVLFAAYDRLPAQVAQPVNYTWAIMLALLSVPLLGQRISGRDWMAAAIAYSGVVVISLRGELPGAATVSLVGLALALASTVIWALYWIFNTRARGDAACRLTLNFLVSLPATALVCLLFSDMDFSFGGGLAAAVWIGLMEMGLPFLTWQMALSLSENTARVSNLIFLSPFLSLQLIHWVLGEQVVSSTYLGLMLILLGLAVQKR